ncbi:hypothetical protein [Streptomyces tendae]|uniref:hypothetical protein n=1 Tax=Streptomyces tendae TaxID=1932 RepID=UPI0036658F6A
MAQYTITFDNGRRETISAVNVNYEPDESQYRFVDEHGRHVAFVPGLNVLSIVVTEWTDDEKAVTG